MSKSLRPQDPLAAVSAMVVDDQVQTRNMIKDSLVAIGVGRVYVCGDGDEAVKMLVDAQFPIDAIVCDWMMPRLSGIEVLKQVRLMRPALPFLMVTAKSDVASVKAAMSEGVSGYIVKPFTAAQLEVKLRVLFKRPQAPSAPAL